jgi:hypothetical protein
MKNVYSYLYLLFLITLVVVSLNHFRESRVEFLYIKDLLPPDAFREIRGLCERLEPHMDEDELSIVRNRKRIILGEGDRITQLLYSSDVQDRLRPLGAKPSTTPVEYRVYGEGGRMGWHCDDQLYLKRQYEIVYTTENTSDSETQWIDPETKQLHSVRTEPNSALVVRSQSVLHRVTPVTHGTRKILKFAYV